MHDAVVTHPEVTAALADGQPVVALESAVITHGLPRRPLLERPEGTDDEFDPAGPCNLETARMLERLVQATGAVAATVAVIKGRLHIGLDADELAQLAADETAAKASVRDLAALSLGTRSAGTTVAATLQACALSRPAPIRVFATGGIGGVHHGFHESLDISADLGMLATSGVCVVCAGVKSILNQRATVEALELLGVPVVGYRSSVLARFIARGDPELTVPLRLDEPADIARLCTRRWETFGQRGAVLVSQPLPEALAVADDLLVTAQEEAHARLLEAGVRGAAVTPFELAALAESTGGRALRANVSLLAANALLAGSIAVELAFGR